MQTASFICGCKFCRFKHDEKLFLNLKHELICHMYMSILNLMNLCRFHKVTGTKNSKCGMKIEEIIGNGLYYSRIAFHLLNNQRGGRMIKIFGLNSGRSRIRIPGWGKWSLWPIAVDARLNRQLYFNLKIKFICVGVCLKRFEMDLTWKKYVFCACLKRFEMV